MLHAASVAATAGGWQVVAHSERTAILRIYCRGDWVGVVVIDARVSPASVCATLARPVERRPLFADKHDVRQPFAVWLYRRLKQQFAPLQSVAVPRPHHRWLPDEAELIAAPIQMATSMLSSRRVSPGYWRFICTRPVTTIVVRLTRWALVLSVGSTVYTECHAGIYDSTVDPPWHAAPDVLGVVEWLFTSILQFQAELEPPRMLAGSPPVGWLPDAQ